MSIIINSARPTLPVTPLHKFGADLPSAIAEGVDYRGETFARSPESQAFVLQDTVEYLHDHRIAFIKVLRSAVKEATGVYPGLKDTKDVVDRFVNDVDRMVHTAKTVTKPVDDFADAFRALTPEQRNTAFARLGLKYEDGGW